MRHFQRLSTPQSIVLLGFAFTLLGFAFPPITVAQTGSIEGRVTEADSEKPLPGVNVVIVGTNTGASTDAQGRFRIENIDPGSYQVRASFIGYKEKTTSVEVTPNQTREVNFALGIKTTRLEEAVVVGYGTQEREDLTGSVSTVDEANLESVPTSSIDNAIKGRAAGVNVVNTNAAPGGATSTRIRGTNSLNAGSEPLYVIDGFPIFPDNTSETTTTNAGAQPINSLATFNLSNIESVQVLKDASATAIYGSRGASGVIVIETAQGTPGETQVDYSGSQSFEVISNGVDMMGAANFARYRNRLAESQGSAPLFSQDDIQQFEQQGGTDWMNEVTEVGSQSDHSLTVSGGNENNTYAVTGNFHRTEGILQNTEFKKFGIRLNLSNELLDDRLELNHSWSYNRATAARSLTNQGSPGGLIITALNLKPTQPVRKENGSFNFPSFVGRFDINPVAELETGINDLRNNRFFGNTQASFEILEGLTLKQRFGADIVFNSRDTFFPSTTQIGRDQDVQLEKAERSIRDILAETTVSYNKQLTDVHSLDAVAGYSFQDAVNRFSSAQAQEFPTDNFNSVNLQTSGDPQIPQSERVEWNLQSFFGRFNYTFDDRYLATFTFRRDGSSKFGEENQWANFPSGALAWRASNESFFENSFLSEYVSNLKIRASWGLSGNSEIPVFQSIGGLESSNFVFGNQLASGLSPNRIPNPDLKWETTEMQNIGLNLGLFSDRLNFTFDYFQNETTDLLLNVNIPASNGFQSQLRNTGELENTGFEITADYRAVNKESFTLDVSGNLSSVDNEITSLGATEPFFAGCIACNHLGVNGSWVAPGESVGVWRGFKSIGIWDSQEEIDNNPSLPSAQPGAVRYKDVNGDGEITRGDDWTVIGDPNPNFTWGFRTNVTYKNFDFTAFLRGVQGQDIRNLQQSENGDGVQRMNQIEGLLENSWTPNNKDASRPKIDANRDFIALRNSDFFIEDGSYIRLQNISLGYTIPDGLKPPFLNRARVYVSAQNVLTITDYSGFDPEVSNAGQSNFNRGDDYDSFPRARTFTTGIDLSF